MGALKSVFDRGESGFCPAGSILFLEGQPPEGVYLLCEGQLELSIRSSKGAKLVLQVIGSGRILGLSAAVSGRPYEATARALTPCRFSFIKRDEFLRLLSQDPQICLQVAKLMSSELRSAYECAQRLRSYRA